MRLERQLIHYPQDAHGILEERVARERGHNPARRAVEQRRPDLVLEVAQLARERRLGDTEELRGAADGLVLDGRDEVAQVTQLDAGRGGARFQHRLYTAVRLARRGGVAFLARRAAQRAEHRTNHRAIVAPSMEV